MKQTGDEVFIAPDLLRNACTLGDVLKDIPESFHSAFRKECVWGDDDTVLLSENLVIKIKQHLGLPLSGIQ